MESNKRDRRRRTSGERPHPDRRNDNRNIDKKNNRDRERYERQEKIRKSEKGKHERQRISEAERRQRSKQQNKRKKAARSKRSTHKMEWIIVMGLLLVVGIVMFTVGEGSKLNKKGLEAFERGEYEAANDYFTKAVNHDENNGKYHMNQGLAQSELKLYDESMKSFETALEYTKRESDRKEIYRARGISYMYQGKYDLANEDFDRVLEGRESRFTDMEQDVLFYKAETEDKAEKYVEAVMTYTKLVDDTKSPDAYMLRGLEYVKVGDNTSAEVDLREAIRKDKKNYEIYLALYKALIGQNKTEEAEAVLEEALTLGGNKGMDLVRQGHIYVKLGRYDDAEKKFQEALDKKENMANLGFAESYINQSKDEEALPYFQAYLSNEKKDARAYNEYGTCLMRLKKYQEAEKAFSDGVALNNRLMDRALSKNRIAAAEQSGNWSKALEYVDIYLQRYSDDEEAVREKAFIETRIR